MLLGPVAQDLDIAFEIAAFGAQRHHLAVGPKARPVLPQVPALVDAAPMPDGRAHLRDGDTGSDVFGREEQIDRLADCLARQPPHDPLGADVPRRDRSIEIEPHDRIIDGAIDDELRLALGQVVSRLG